MNTEEKEGVGEPEKKSNKKLVIVLVVLLVLIAGMAIIFYQKTISLGEGSQTTEEQEIAALIEKVGELIILPQNEEPTVATVADTDGLTDQPFFEKAKVGDKVLIYTEAKKAILYDPVAHRLIEVAPLSVGGETGE